MLTIGACLRLQDFFCVAWQGADWDGKASSSGGGWKPCPTELRYAPKDVSFTASRLGFSMWKNEHAQPACVSCALGMWYDLPWACCSLVVCF